MVAMTDSQFFNQTNLIQVFSFLHKECLVVSRETALVLHQVLVRLIVHMLQKLITSKVCAGRILLQFQNTYH